MAKTSSRADLRPQDMVRLIAALVLVIVIVALIAYGLGHRGSGAAPATSSPPATPSPSPVAAGGGGGECATANLAGSLDATGGGTAGTLYRQLILTNHGSSTCTVYGFPGVSLVDGAGTQLGLAASRNGSAGSTITLAPGQAAAAPVGFPDAGNFTPGTCSAASTNLKVYPPDQTTALTIPLVAQYCPGFSVQTLVAH